jgi:hypothetical protein
MCPKSRPHSLLQQRRARWACRRVAAGAFTAFFLHATGRGALLGENHPAVPPGHHAGRCCPVAANIGWLEGEGRGHLTIVQICSAHVRGQHWVKALAEGGMGCCGRARGAIPRADGAL